MNSCNGVKSLRH